MPTSRSEQPHNTKIRIDVVVSEITDGEQHLRELGKILTIWTNGAEILKNPRFINSKLIVASQELPAELLKAYSRCE